MSYTATAPVQHGRRRAAAALAEDQTHHIIRAGRHQGIPRPESWTGGGADRARTRRAGAYTLLDWGNLPLACSDWS